MHLAEIREGDPTVLHPRPMAAQCSPFCCLDLLGYLLGCESFDLNILRKLAREQSGRLFEC